VYAFALDEPKEGHMTESMFWWSAAGIAVAVELATGTFYLLMLAIGLAAGALAAQAGASQPAQLLVAAVVGGGAVTALRLQRRGTPRPKAARANPDVNPDIGETLQVDAWQPDGTASVRYRGANWTVIAAPGSQHERGAHRVREVVGNKLAVEKI
jgi:membrane protein implicated in regulation of membrane protease activity